MRMREHESEGGEHSIFSPFNQPLLFGLRMQEAEATFVRSIPVFSLRVLMEDEDPQKVFINVWCV